MSQILQFKKSGPKGMGEKSCAPPSGGSFKDVRDAGLMGKANNPPGMRRFHSATQHHCSCDTMRSPNCCGSLHVYEHTYMPRTHTPSMHNPRTHTHTKDAHAKDAHGGRRRVPCGDSHLSALHVLVTPGSHKTIPASWCMSTDTRKKQKQDKKKKRKKKTCPP